MRGARGACAACTVQAEWGPRGKRRHDAEDDGTGSLTLAEWRRMDDPKWQEYLQGWLQDLQGRRHGLADAGGVADDGRP
jgi:hypothetical protein